MDGNELGLFVEVGDGDVVVGSQVLQVAQVRGVDRPEVVQDDEGELLFATFDEDVVVGYCHHALEEVLHVLVVVQEDVGALGELLELGGLAARRHKGM